MSSELFKNAIKRKTQDVPPVWMMRQAGRYHRHYQKLKEKHTFMELCKNSELAAEVALGPIMDFDFDVSILFSDLLFPLEALGMDLFYDPGPKFTKNLESKDLTKLRKKTEALEYLKFQKTAAELTRKALPKSKSLIGFVGGPWTLFSYAVSGGHDGNLIGPKTQLGFFKDFCEILVPLLIDNIQLQLDGGAEVVMIFDTAAGELSPFIYNQYVVPELNKLAQAIPNRLGYYSKSTQAPHMTEIRKNSNWLGFGFDHRWDLPLILKESKSGFVQGNFDQSLLFCLPEDFKLRFKEWLMPIKNLSSEERAGWVCGLGHGVLPKTPEENVRNFVKMIRDELSQ
jgi:uroporphyrinogen decarboxylase